MRKRLYVITTVIFMTAAAFRPGPLMEGKVKQATQEHKYTNHLVSESSPYLLMHAHNPVDWYPWGKQALDKAKKENKLLIISIGYAACHWCHVMEEESFSDEEVARLMNRHFVSIKVDREERPDIDQVYMNAVQLLTGRGGWPLNAVALPDGRPVFAGTYFSKENWLAVLSRLQALYQEKPQSLLDQAELVTEGIQKSDLVVLNREKRGFEPGYLDQVFANWKTRLDPQWGGERGAPKFPLPIAYRFLLHYHYLSGDKQALDAVKTTLDRMAMGGIYDQLGGGFARYSTDSYWKVPHFEKMLYDNAQLVSLYAYAYQLTKEPLYKRVVYETLAFVERELTAPTNGFYSSLDADSEGEEGKFYVWQKEEIEKVLGKGKESALILDYFNVSEQGNWEAGKNILFRTERDRIDPKQLLARVEKAKQQLFSARSKRIRPALDDKILTAWNALMLTGYVDAYRVFAEERFLQKALENAAFLQRHMLGKDGSLRRTFKAGKSAINGFLDDYAFTIRAFISLYAATFAEEWLFSAETLLKYTLEHFFDDESGMFFYTSDLDARLIARKMESTDNVMPASNSVMAENLYLLGEYFYKKEWLDKAEQMLHNVKANLIPGASHYANWSKLAAFFSHKPFEVAIVGDDCLRIRKELDRHYLPNVILLGGKSEGRLPLLQNKRVEGQTFIYVCRDKACLLPVTTTEEALEQIWSHFDLRCTRKSMRVPTNG